MRASLKGTLLFVASLAVSAGAWAHGAESGVAHQEASFWQGMLHPLTGVDHLAAMLVVGLWSATTAGRLWVAPLAFANFLLAGAILGLSGFGLPVVEPMIAASLLVLGLLVSTRQQLPSLAGAALVGGFALFHGIAHGQELAVGTHWLAPLLGMLASTVALHIVGVVTGLVLRERSLWWSRAAGALVAVLGTALLAQMA